MKPINAITEYIRINVLPVISFFSASVAAYNFYKIWQRDASTFIWVIAIVSGIVLIIVFGVIGFSKKEIESSIPMNAPTEGMRFPKLYKYARIAFVVTIIMFIAGGLYLYKQQLVLKDKFVVLVFNIDGIKNKEFRFTDLLLSDLDDNINGDEIHVISQAISLSEIDGSNKARKLGDRYQADLVIWGWYGITSTDAIAHIHIENMNIPNRRGFKLSDIYKLESSVVEVEGYQLQNQLSDSLIALVWFCKGVISYETGFFSEARNQFLKSLNHDAWVDLLTNKAILYLYMADTDYQLGDLDSSIKHYSLAIQADGELYPAYINRGIMHFWLGEYETAITDFTIATEIDNENPHAFSNRGALYVILQMPNEAIEDFSQVLSLDPTREDIYLARGKEYIQVNADENAKADFLKVLEISNNAERLLEANIMLEDLGFEY